MARTIASNSGVLIEGQVLSHVLFSFAVPFTAPFSFLPNVDTSF